MIKNIALNKIVFLDIETVPQVYQYEDLPEISKKFWDKKAGLLKRKEDDTPAILYQKAGIYAEFAKVICISVGVFHENHFCMKSFFGDDEKSLLADFSDFLGRLNARQFILCGHNGKEFDFPFLARRMLIHHFTLPDLLDHQGKKPWEVPHLDTLELWKFGDYKSYISLDLLTHILDIKSPKGDIEGSDVGRVYYEENDLTRIEEYCRRDVVAVAQIILRFMNLELINVDDIEVL
ncbi:MAG: 3'-5' exonuclease [Bacteroidota bacterium]